MKEEQFIYVLNKVGEYDAKYCPFRCQIFLPHGPIPFIEIKISSFSRILRFAHIYI